jgi:hypothetical protein
MTRSLMYLAMVATLTNAPGTCSTSDSGNSAAPAQGSSGGDWASLGATACAKYFPPDVAGALLSEPPGTPKTLSRQACSLHADGGTITLMLMADGPAVFDAFVQHVSDPRPLPGVGDKAVQHRIGIVAFKAPSRLCKIDAVGAPGFLRQSAPQLAQSLGAVCNQLFAATP